MDDVSEKNVLDKCCRV